MPNYERAVRWYLDHTWRMTREAAQWTVDYFCMIDNPRTGDYENLYIAERILNGELPCKA